MDYISLNKDTYDAIASQFSGTRDYLWEDLKMLEQYVRPNCAIVDIGCGNGRLYQLFQKSQCFYLGIDQSTALISLAKNKFTHAKFEVQEMTSLSLKSNFFDQAWLMASFHHLPDADSRIDTLKTIRTSLKKEGSIIMLNWNMDGEWVQKKVAQGAYTKVGKQDYIVPWRNGKKHNFGDRFYHGFTKDELQTLASQADLQVQEIYYTKMGEHSTKDDGDNLVSVFTRA